MAAPTSLSTQLEGVELLHHYSYHVIRYKVINCLHVLSLVHWLMYAASPGGKDR